MSGEGFLARWSRRKRGETEEDAPEAAPSPAVPSATASEAVPSPAAEPAFDLPALPDLDSLTAASDVRAFLAKGVPLALRTAALRKMWTLDPAIRDFVGPADYAWDYNAPGGVPGFSSELPEEARRWLVRQIDGSRDDIQASAEGATVPAEPSGTVDLPPRVVADAAVAGEAEANTAASETAPAAQPARRHGSATPA